MDSFECRAGVEVENHRRDPARPNTGGHGSLEQCLYVLRSVVEVPDALENSLPFLSAHAGMGCHSVFGIVFVSVGIQFDTLEVQVLMVFGSRTRRQHEEFHYIDRQFALNNADIALDTLRSISR